MTVDALSIFTQEMLSISQSYFLVFLFMIKSWLSIEQRKSFNMQSRRRWSRMASAAVLLVGVSTVGLAGTANAAPGEDYVPANERVSQIAAQYWAENPNDYSGLARTIRAHGGDSVTFMIRGHGMVSGAKAQELYAKSKSETGNENKVSSAQPADIPNNSFAVVGSWYHVQDQYGEWWNATGYWNFRDDYIGTGDPGDVSAVTAEVNNCWINDGATIFASDYQGNDFTGSMIRQGSGVNSSIYSIDDSTSNFKMLNDNGTHTLSFKRNSYGCGGTPLQARYYYEHNQGGGSLLSFSLSLGIFSITYGGNPMTLERATPVFRT
ncbi:hypothetical protein [Actinopolyspora erythraea]|uniref:hypothetical protein n=1 Tax=Actinopolyspora erythraea TaxID=414996 RepID=UPI001186B833|nr:hypothetical protein [Actinopolyspora erythraea]